MTLVANLLPVIGQHLLAGFREPRAILLQAAQHDLVAIVHVGATEPRNVPRTGVVSLLRGGAGSEQNEGNDERKSGHFEAPAVGVTVAF